MSRRERRRRPGEIDLPGDEIDLPGDVHLPDLSDLTGPEMVDLLPTDQPLAMFPVRLATRFHRPAPGERPTELWVRIFPDQIHADGHLPELTATEIAIGQAYWRRVRGRGGAADASRWITDQLGAPRAAWVVQQTRPTNPKGPPEFPPLVARTEVRPTLARLLPDRWLVVVRRSVEHVRRVWSGEVRRDLAMAPNLVDLPPDGGIRHLFQNQDLSWMIDFEKAVEAGMAVKVPWEVVPGQPVVTELVVLGVRGPDAGAAGELTGLLDAHRFTSGVELVPQGTPTNNTDTVTSGFAGVPDDLPAHLDRQSGPVTAHRPALAPAFELGTVGAADAASIALGLEAANAFDVAEHAGRRWGSWARDMNRTLFPATWGYFLPRLLGTADGGPLSLEDREWLRDWFGNWVRGPGFLPTFRIGDQPYGILPVARRAGWGDELGSSNVDRLADVLRDLDTWSRSLARVANFSSEGGAPPTMEQEAARLAAVLGAVPHPTAFRLREAPNLYDDLAAEWATQLPEMERLLRASHTSLWRDAYELDQQDEITGGTLDQQDHGLWRLRDSADRITENDGLQIFHASAAAARDFIDRTMLPLTAAHGIRAETRNVTGTSAWEGSFSGAHLPTAGDPALWYVRYGADGSSADGTFPTLRLVPDASPASVAADLRRYAADARKAGGLPRVGYIPGTAASLLEKLIEHAVENVPSTQFEELALGLEGLADLVEGDASDDPLGELERLLRETLGLATHRYDAWATSLANRRLALLRADRPTGLQVGGYGWLVNLRPDDGAGPDNKGFIHAPSIDHAVTGAVLRSAWLAYATSASDAPFGVDLSSERVRRATWLLDGVRNGVDLGELLGARLERRLHDGGLSHLIADVRERVSTATGTAERPAGAIVDGLAVAVAYSGPAPDDPVRATLDELRATLDGFPDDRLLPRLRGAVADLDATADLLTAQAVHSVTKGNLAEAAATLSVAGAGDAGIPPLRVPSVHRDSRLVNHRVVAVLATPAAEPPTLLSIAEPALAGWLATLVPALDQVAVTVTAGDAGRWTSTLAATGLSAVEVVALAATGGDLAASRLGALLAARCRYETGAGPDVPVRFVDGELDDLAVAAGALRSAVGGARPLRGDDLTETAEQDHAIEVGELDGRRLALAAALEGLAALPPAPDLLVTRFADLAALDPEGLTAALSRPDDRHDLTVGLLARAAASARALLRPLPDDLAAMAPQAQADLLRDRIAEALSLAVPILPRHTPANAADLAAGFSATPPVSGAPVVALTWLMEVGKVHPGAGRCQDALDLVEAIRPAAPVRLQVAQLPHVPGEPWVARAAPIAPGPRLNVLSVSDAAGALDRGPVSGLIFDAWSEPIPGRFATTGLAVHFDRPGAQPPQAVLLLTPPEEGRWTVDEIETQLLQTLELAQIRAVGPETLNHWGHTLPAIFLDEGTAVDTVDEDVP